MKALLTFICLCIAAMSALASDLRFDDESAYLERGISLVQAGQEIEASYGPLYSKYLGEIWSLLDSAIQTYYANIVLLSLTYCFLMYFGLRMGKVEASLAALVTILMGLSYGNILLFPKVGLFTCCLVIAGWIVIRFLQRSAFVYGVGLLILVTCSFGRAEILVAAIVYGIWMSIVLVLKKRWLGLSLLVCSLILSLSATSSWGVPTEGGRSFDAFSDHYQVSLSKKGMVKAENRFRDGKELTKEVFPKSDSVIDAMLERPVVFISHVGRNLVGLPNSLANLLSPMGVKPIGWMFALAVGIGCHRRSKSIDVSEKAIEVAWVYMISVFMAEALACLIVYPRESYIVILSLPIGVALSEALSILGDKSNKSVWRALIVLSIGLILALYCLVDFKGTTGRRNLILVRRMKVLDPGKIGSGSFGSSLFIGGEGWSEMSFREGIDGPTHNCLDSWKRRSLRYILWDSDVANSRFINRNDDCKKRLSNALGKNIDELNEENLVSVLEIGSNELLIKAKVERDQSLHPIIRWLKRLRGTSYAL